MPGVAQNLAYLKGCLRKRPFKSKEEAQAKRAEDFNVYQCLFCGQWHRTSKPHHKQSRTIKTKRGKTLKRIKALMRRDYFKSLKQWEDTQT